jgi:SAM-dependent methyltransferase
VPGGRILVPGCGAGHDLATLAREDREVVGVDLSETARDAFARSHADLPGSVVYEVVDFFAYDAAEGFDFVWDYTFFCALDPSERPGWADAMARLIKPFGTLGTLLFPFEDPISDREGPPWPINAGLIGDLLEDTFESLEVREVRRSHRGREGKERLALWRRRPV